MQVKWRDQHLTAEQKISIVTDYNSGMPIKMICKRHLLKGKPITKQTIYNVLRKMAKE